eukprot:GABV01006125.1.p1 GENE.GABV01006125.1~~GABV01006125.1.p1  ORF type:complete len:121 (-),score=24.02 GABV01006125.1:11-373(-)
MAPNQHAELLRSVSETVAANGHSDAANTPEMPAALTKHGNGASQQTLASRFFNNTPAEIWDILFAFAGPFIDRHRFFSRVSRIFNYFAFHPSCCKTIHDLGLDTPQLNQRFWASTTEFLH